MLEARGTLVDDGGQWWEGSDKQPKRNLDLSRMNLEWVQGTDDPLFADLSRTERLVLYLVFVREYTWEMRCRSLLPAPKPGARAFWPGCRRRWPDAPMKRP